MNVHVIQFTSGGIPDDPRIFATAEAANIEWQLLWKFHGYRFGLDGKPVRSMRAALLDNDGYLSRQSDGEDEVRRYEVPVLP